VPLPQPASTPAQRAPAARSATAYLIDRPRRKPFTLAPFKWAFSPCILHRIPFNNTYGSSPAADLSAIISYGGMFGLTRLSQYIAPATTICPSIPTSVETCKPATFISTLGFTRPFLILGRSWLEFNMRNLRRHSYHSLVDSLFHYHLVYPSATNCTIETPKGRQSLSWPQVRPVQYAYSAFTVKTPEAVTLCPSGFLM
jgi:hypothetical protein